MHVILISIGDELLAGRTVNTNAAWIGDRLASAGHPVHSVLTIGDDLTEIRDTIARACADADLVVVTGGLGPTDDDVTREAICMLLGCDMAVHEGQLELIRRRFAETGRALNERSERQARVPSACDVLPNLWGTAPGLSFAYGRAVAYVLPGVPSEMRQLFSAILRERIAPADGFGERVWLLHGIPESLLAQRLEPLEGLLDEHLGIAYLPSDGTIRLRLVRRDADRKTMERFAHAASRIEEIAGQWILSDRNELPAETLGRTLTELGLTVAVAESCTGGLLGAAITDVPGSSGYFPGGLITYGNREKEELLGVSHDVIERFGAVSEQVALAMAAGARKRIEADYAVSITGIAGPDGGTPEKPVGTVWVAIDSREGTRAELLRLKGERDVIRRFTVNTALALLLRRVRNEHPSDDGPAGSPGR